MSEAVVIPVWDGFGHRGGDMCCLVCERPVDEYGLNDEEHDERLRELIDATLGSDTKYLCLDCAKEAGVDNAQVGELVELGVSAKRMPGSSPWSFLEE